DKRCRVDLASTKLEVLGGPESSGWGIRVNVVEQHRFAFAVELADQIHAGHELDPKVREASEIRFSGVVASDRRSCHEVLGEVVASGRDVRTGPGVVITAHRVLRLCDRHRRLPCRRRRSRMPQGCLAAGHCEKRAQHPCPAHSSPPKRFVNDGSRKYGLASTDIFVTMSQNRTSRGIMVKVAARPRLCPLIAFDQIVGGKYKLRILWDLMKGPRRYGELRRSVLDACQGKPVTPRVLSRELKELEKRGLIHRKQY